MNFDRGRSFSFKKPKTLKNYKIINDFDNINEKYCIKLDKENEAIYNKLLSKSKQAQNTILNTGLSMNLEVPMPPRPNNRDRFMLWKKRNVQKPVIRQTEAVLFLQENGYKLNIHYEAYQAIDLYNEIRKKKGIKNHYVDNTKNFDDLYTKKDRNIFRRRSMRGLESLTKNNVCKNSQIQYPNQNQFSNHRICNRSHSFNGANSENMTHLPHRANTFNGNSNNLLRNSDDLLSNSNDIDYLLENNLNMDLNIFDNSQQQNIPQNDYHNQGLTMAAPSAPPPNPEESLINENIKNINEDNSENVCTKSNNEDNVDNENNTDNIDNLDKDNVDKEDSNRNSLYPCL